MPNYNVSNCTTGVQYIISAGTLSINDVISFYVDEAGPFCGTVLSVSTDSHVGLYDSPYNSCCECLSGAALVQSFIFENCVTKESINVDLTTFCNTANFAPFSENVFKFYEVANPTNNFCAKYISNSRTSGTTNYEPESEIYQNCSECENGVPRSANTEVFICEICCPCTTGATINSVVPPHPVWTDSQGTAVIQLNMVVLGGENGLNS